MKRVALLVIFFGSVGGTVASVAHAQSRLYGDQYTFSATNFQGDTGVVYDPIVDDRFNNPIDTGTPPAILTFDGIEETVAGMKINERAEIFAGIPGGIFVTGYADQEADATIWENPGEIIEFSYETADGGYISSDFLGPSLISTMNLDWSNSVAGSMPSWEFLDEEGGFDQGGFYFYFTNDGVPITGYETIIDIGLLVGEHPFDGSVPEVVYIAYSRGQTEEIIAPYDGGFNYTQGTTQLDDDNPDDTSWAALATVMDLSTPTIQSINGFRVGFLVTPPEADTTIRGDFNSDGVLDAEDIDELTRQSALGTNPPNFDLTDDGLVNSDDVYEWINADDIFYSWMGDADLDKEFKSDDVILVLSENTYENDVDAVWSSGDFNGDGRFTAQDVIDALADNGYENGPRTDVASVPEPASASLLVLGGLLLLARNRRNR